MVSSISCFLQVLKDGSVVGAAVLGVPAKATIKEVSKILQLIGHISVFDDKNLHSMQYAGK